MKTRRSSSSSIKPPPKAGHASSVVVDLGKGSVSNAPTRTEFISRLPEPPVLGTRPRDNKKVDRHQGVAPQF